VTVHGTCCSALKQGDLLPDEGAFKGAGNKLAGGRQVQPCRPVLAQTLVEFGTREMPGRKA